MKLCLVALAALGLVACLESIEPETGALMQEICVNEDSDPDTTVSFSRDIVPNVLDEQFTSCLNCHAPDSPTPIGFQVGGLDLSNYQGLRSGGNIGRLNNVIPGQPCESVLLQKIKSAPPFGGRMPLSGPPFVSEANTQLLHDWIFEGAQNN